MIRKAVFALNLVGATSLLIAAIAPMVNPNTAVWPAFFGMAFLPLFALNLLFLLLWLLWKMPNALYSGLVLLISLGSFNHHYHYALNTDNSQETDVKLASYNVRLFDLYNWNSNRRTRDSILTYLHNLDADILCIQEFFKSNDKTYFNTLDTLRTVQRARTVHEEYSQVLSNGRYQFGIATLSSYPIIQRSRVPLGELGHNMAIYSDILIGNDTIRVFNFHLASLRISGMEQNIANHIEEEDRVGQVKDAIKVTKLLAKAFRKRAEQVHAVKEAIEASPYPVVVCGDLNDTPGSYAYRTLSEGLTDAFMEFGRGTGSTYFGFFPSFRIDYLLFSPEFTVSSFRTDDVAYSDHRPVITTFYLTAAGSE